MSTHEVRKQNSVADSGAGISVRYPDGEITVCSFPTGKHHMTYKAETEALMQAASIIYDAGKDYHQIVFPV